MADPAARSVTAFEAVVRPGRYGAEIGEPGVTAIEVQGAGLASITARMGQRAALVEAVQATFAIALPLTPRRIEANGIAFIGCGPDQWLVHATPAPEAGMEVLLGPSCTGLASIVDQSHGRTVLRLSGRRVRDTLAKGLGLDLHPRVFAVDHAATTSIAHIGVQLWQTSDGPLGPTYEISVPRSATLSFWRWLEASAAEYGLELRAGPA